MPYMWDDKTAVAPGPTARESSPRPPPMGQPQPMSQIAGRAPMRRMQGAAAPGPQRRMTPEQFHQVLSAREMMAKSELLKIRAIKSLMGGGGAPRGRPRGGNSG